MVELDASSPTASPQGLEAAFGRIQALTEKLGALNSQLRGRIAELESTNADLEDRLAKNQCFALAVQAITGVVYDWNPSTDEVHRSEGVGRLLGTPPEQPAPTATWWSDRVHPDDLAAIRTDALRAFSGPETAYDFEYRLRHEDGRWIDVWDRGLIMRDADGRATRAVGIATDISERKRAEERDRLLMAELDHRVKNILASIAAVARQTSVDKASVEEFVEALIGRVQAMARAHSLLSLSRWEGASLHSLVAEELAPYRTPEGFGVGGESVLLRPKAAQALAMALHELATNAAKHGAFASPGGRVEVAWQREEEQAVVLVWRERTRRPIARPEAQGFGSVVLEQLLPHELGARVALDYQPTGLVCTMRIPLSQFSGEMPDRRLGRGGQPGAAAPRAPARERILIVEDSGPATAALAEAVEDLGGDVVGPAHTLEEAFELARTSRLDAAILDLDLDGADLRPLAERLTDAHVPFVLVSDGERALPACARLAEAHVLDKPVQPRRLAAILRSILAS